MRTLKKVKLYTGQYNKCCSGHKTGTKLILGAMACANIDDGLWTIDERRYHFYRDFYDGHMSYYKLIGRRVVTIKECFWRLISKYFTEKIEAMWTISFKTLFQNKSENQGKIIHARGFALAGKFLIFFLQMR